MAQWETAQSNLIPGRRFSIPHSKNSKLNSQDQFFDKQVEPEIEEGFFEQEEFFDVLPSPKNIDQQAVSTRNKKAHQACAKKTASDSPLKGLKKRSLKKAKELGMPPTPTGHNWHVSEGGWNLVKSWSEKDGLLGQKVKKERYAGFLSKEAWQVMKEYEYEKIIAKIGQ